MANYEEKTVLMDEATSKRAVSRIAYEIVERNRGTENLVIIGIQTKGKCNNHFKIVEYCPNCRSNGPVSLSA